MISLLKFCSILIVSSAISYSQDFEVEEGILSEIKNAQDAKNISEHYTKYMAFLISKESIGNDLLSKNDWKDIEKIELASGSMTKSEVPEIKFLGYNLRRHLLMQRRLSDEYVMEALSYGDEDKKELLNVLSDKAVDAKVCLYQVEKFLLASEASSYWVSALDNNPWLSVSEQNLRLHKVDTEKTLSVIVTRYAERQLFDKSDFIKWQFNEVIQSIGEDKVSVEKCIYYITEVALKAESGDFLDSPKLMYLQSSLDKLGPLGREALLHRLEKLDLLETQRENFQLDDLIKVLRQSLRKK